ncbi:acyl-CoA thioesterase [Pseudodesulfovibrio senegalensis]|jgi:acyl-CoA hydrolase|uniref:Acyl-CoA thioesterase n=1 Tax=Pseudodesulfovibrio senegalensis TaxID=1721087 RepID=A0A6N6N2R6_9BACT|nr:acyl-CoA thioesterase [Pseudodesulfovibrio senegalensis]KAB1441732.1 acyl-CoA thioesterase [Pseudodesulfovibrio senegalensis]
MVASDTPRELESKCAKESEVIMTHLVLPSDTNPAGNLHGGVILKHMDIAGGVVCKRHSRSNVVTAGIDRVDFEEPAYVGELLTFKASLNYVGRSSMEVGIRVEAENLQTGHSRHTNSAYLTYVALDPEGKPLQVPPLRIETGIAERRHREAINRLKARRQLKAQERQEQD